MARVIRTSRKSRDLNNRMPEPDVNVVSLMDILTTLLFFLILMASFSNFAVIPSMSLQNSTQSSGKPKPAFNLTFTLFRENIRLYMGPTENLRYQKAEELNGWLNRKWTGNAKLGYYRKLPYQDGNIPHNAIQDILVTIKKSFPSELKIILAVTDGVKYQNVVDTLMSIRELDSRHDPFMALTPMGTQELSRVLFPQVLITEWNEEERASPAGT